MNRRRAVWGAVFLAFFGYTVYVILVRDVSLWAYLAALRPGTWAAQILVDLYVACTLLGLWIVRDARRRGEAAGVIALFLVLTLLLASMGPLLYLIYRERPAREAAGPDSAGSPAS